MGKAVGNIAKSGYRVVKSSVNWSLLSVSRIEQSLDVALRGGHNRPAGGWQRDDRALGRPKRRATATARAR
jgi:hypothetical protein